MKIRLLLVALIAALMGMSYWISSTESKPERIEVGKQALPPSTKKLKNATMAPGRVVELHTTKGEIDFVLFEKDCPKTAGRIAKLVQNGAYNGVKFPRVENWLIQTDESKKSVQPMGCEILEGLTHAKGTVGMARADNNYNSNTSIFYILLEPQPGLDMEYTNFGRLINGMDVALKIKKNDSIISARVRPFTSLDKKRFNEVLRIEAERRVE